MMQFYRTSYVSVRKIEIQSSPEIVQPECIDAVMWLGRGNRVFFQDAFQDASWKGYLYILVRLVRGTYRQRTIQNHTSWQWVLTWSVCKAQVIEPGENTHTRNGENMQTPHGRSIFKSVTSKCSVGAVSVIIKMWVVKQSKWCTILNVECSNVLMQLK